MWTAFFKSQKNRTMKNVEIKARCYDTDKIRNYLKQHNAKFIGIDKQTDTYFNVPNGRLKLRQGNIENHLIFYSRPDSSSPKRSDVILYKSNDDKTLKELLTKSLGIKIQVKKTREIYFIDNVKFHIDTIEGLGEFVEIEAQDKDDSISESVLNQQCQFYLQELGIDKQNLLQHSYSDMLMKQKGK